MSGVIEYFIGFDVFTAGGWFPWVYMIAFLVAFIWVNLRAWYSDAWERAVLITAGTMFISLLAAFTPMPRFWAGIWLIVGYIISSTLVNKPAPKKALSNTLSLTMLLLIFAFIPVPFGYIFSAFSLTMYYLLSEFDIRSQKRKAEHKNNKEKK